MRVTNNMVTDNLLGHLQQLDTQQSTLQTEVATGLRISQPSDDPAAVSSVLELQSQQSQLQQYGTNASHALTVAQASYGGLNSLVQIYDRASELATLGAGGQSSGTAHSYAAEVDQLVQQAVAVANSQLGSQYLYGGTAVDAAPFTAATNGQGQITGVTYNGNSGTQPIPLSSTTSISPWSTGATNAGIGDFINNLVSLRDALQNNDQSALSAANAGLNTSEDVLTSAVAENGAVQGRIQSDQTQQQAGLTEIGTQISSLTDADLPSTIVNLSQTQLAYQAAMQTASNVLQLSLLNYIH